MVTKYIQRGDLLTTANASGSTVSSGGVIVSGRQIRIAEDDIANGASGPCWVEGVFELAATTTDTWADGAAVYWNASTSKLTSTAGSNVLAGYGVGAKTNGQTTANVKLASTPT